MRRSLREVAKFVQGRIVGDDAVEITGISSPSSAAAGALVFVEDEKNLGLAMESKASAVIAGEFAAAAEASKPLLISAQPRLAFARAAQMLCPGGKTAPGVHPAAVVHPSAQLGKHVAIGERVCIGEGVKVGDHTQIAANCVVGTSVVLGNDCQLYPNVTIYPGVRIGNRVIIHAGAVLGSDGFGYVRDGSTGRYEKFPQVGWLEVGDDVEIGANSTVDRGALDGTRIGRGTKIDNLVHIG
ncbi:MAG TPA: UDP-3-O-(3-hydroxymyristoyl)glucosamine N-acyltransferase, partial [Terriglobales bacterium]